MNRCAKCGDCCEFIGLGVTLDEVEADPNFPDRDFVLEHWTPTEVPKDKPNPLMSDKCFDGYVWYKCDLFNEKTRLCKDYKNRPEMCKNYPGKNRKPETLISARCGFMPEDLRSKL